MEKQLNLRNIQISNEIFLGTVVEMIRQGSVIKINVKGSSMKPFLHEGDSVLLKSVAKEDINLGDIILGKYHNNYVLHRAVGVKSDCVLLAGDNNLCQVERINEDDIFAVATCLVNGLVNKDLTSFFNRYLGLMWYYMRPFRKLYFKIFK